MKPLYTCAGCGLGVFVALNGSKTTVIRACPCAASTPILASAAMSAKGSGGMNQKRG